MLWTSMAASGTGSLVFIDDVTADRSSRMNSEVHSSVLSAHVQPNGAKLIGRYFTVLLDNGPKHTAKTMHIQYFILYYFVKLLLSL